MISMIDVAADCSSHVGCLKTAGIQTLGRYYCFTTQIPGKKLTWQEAQLIGAAGLQLVAIWESGAPTGPSYFSYDKGRQDGLGALQQAHVVGQPQNSAIFFTVDYDAASVDLAGPIADYFEGVQESLGSTYRVGVYGSGLTCKTIISAGLAHLGWLAGATGWADYGAFPNWVIRQGEQKSVCGLLCDPNETQGSDIGSFTPMVQHV